MFCKKDRLFNEYMYGNYCFYSEKVMHTNESITPGILIFIYFYIKKINLIKMYYYSFRIYIHF